jgi:hypothetical protein
LLLVTSTKQGGKAATPRCERSAARTPHSAPGSALMASRGALELAALLPVALVAELTGEVPPPPSDVAETVAAALSAAPRFAELLSALSDARGACAKSAEGASHGARARLERVTPLGHRLSSVSAAARRRRHIPR